MATWAKWARHARPVVAWPGDPGADHSAAWALIPWNGPHDEGSWAVWADMLQLVAPDPARDIAIAVAMSPFCIHSIAEAYSITPGAETLWLTARFDRGKFVGFESMPGRLQYLPHNREPGVGRALIRFG